MSQAHFIEAPSSQSWFWPMPAADVLWVFPVQRSRMAGHPSVSAPHCRFGLRNADFLFPQRPPRYVVLLYMLEHQTFTWSCRWSVDIAAVPVSQHSQVLSKKLNVSRKWKGFLLFCCFLPFFFPHLTELSPSFVGIWSCARLERQKNWIPRM